MVEEVHVAGDAQPDASGQRGYCDQVIALFGSCGDGRHGGPALTGRTGMAGGPLVSGRGSVEEVDDDLLFGLGRR